MAKKRKYCNFILYAPGEIFGTGEDYFESHCYQGVFAEYMKHESATVYGLPVDWATNPHANYEVIMTK